MQRSDSIVNLVKALAVAQSKIKNPKKNTKNTFFGSSYADLAEVLDMVRDSFDGTGLSFIQMPTYDGDIARGTLTLETTLFHETGEWITSTWSSPVPNQKARDGKDIPIGPQAIGSATTYMRRYAVTAMVGIAQDDDDGESLSDQNRKGGKDGGQDHQEERKPQQPARQAASQTTRAVNQDDKLRRDQPDAWPLEAQEEFAALSDRLYKAFKVASTIDKYNADAERWKANKAKDPASTVLPAMMKWTETLEKAAKEAAAKKADPAAPADPAAEPAA
jgi:hypothetical protein